MPGKKRDVGTGSVQMTEPEKITYSSTTGKCYFANCRRLGLLFRLTLKPWRWHVRMHPNSKVYQFKKKRLIRPIVIYCYESLACQCTRSIQETQEEGIYCMPCFSWVVLSESCLGAKQNLGMKGEHVHMVVLKYLEVETGA